MQTTCNLAIFIAAHSLKDQHKTANEIFGDVTIVKAINWIQLVWRSVKGETIINCFKKVAFQTDLSFTSNPEKTGQEFENLLKHFVRAKFGYK